MYFSKKDFYLKFHFQILSDSFVVVQQSCLSRPCIKYYSYAHIVVVYDLKDADSPQRSCQAA